MDETTNTLNNAAGMAATGVGLGIMTLGAMIPLTILKRAADNMGETSHDHNDQHISKQVSMPQIVLPKINMSGFGSNKKGRVF